MNWLRWTLLAQVIFFLSWAGYESWRRVNAPIVILETLPVDPRDLFAGKYMQLRFAIGETKNLSGFPTVEPRLGAQIAVLLKPMEEVRIAEKVYRVWRPTACHSPQPIFQEPVLDGGRWVAGEYIGQGRVRYGVERYYFNEKRTTELSQVRSGHVWVEAVVGRDGKLALKNLLY